MGHDVIKLPDDLVEAPTPTSILIPLNVLSHTLVPDVTCAALIKLWWYSLDDVPSCSTSLMWATLQSLERRYDRPIMYSAKGLGKAARRGDFPTMDFWLSEGLLDGFGERSGWLMLSLQQGRRLWRRAAVATCARAGHLQVIEWWWLHFPSSVKCTEEMIDAAIEGGGHLHVLEWWIDKFPLHSLLKSDNKKLQVAVLKHVADLASRHGQVHILKWWFDVIVNFSKSHRKRTEAAVDQASFHGHIDVLDFWLGCSNHLNSHRRMPFKYKNALNWACWAGRLDDVSMTVDCLDWRLKHGIPTRFSPDGMRLLSASGRMDVLEWVSRQGIQQRLDEHILSAVCAAGHVAVLTWWLQHVGESTFRACAEASIGLLATRHWAVIDWWVERTDKVAVMSTSKDAMGNGHAPAGSMIRDCVDLCMTEADYEPLAWCLDQYPEYARQAFDLERIRYSLGRIQFGLVEFFHTHGVLPRTPTIAEFRYIDNSSLTHLMNRPAYLPLLDWLHKCHDPGLELRLFSRDVEEASRRGDFRLVRWAKRKHVRYTTMM
ncbi:hypothetical protein BCR44DRAFT_1510880 [Catenaria anguillulae PL171]|uniref:Ankyrin repeat-containing domain protein n=1 Tax=Catenaria anguillulae PL171 TaxID=765915 RepID=A0A1Y2HV69_9FUNG|nr:hypothetical protein BCR44DRAFT_1510880 [Catenaria anguillulae PL171]